MAITKDFIVTDGLTVGSGVLAASANVTGNARVGGDLTVVGNITGSLTVSNNLTINGNLTVSGTTMYVNTATLNVSDNIITLNADWLANTAPTENAGFEINRGSAANVAFRWNETGDIWEITQDGTNYGRVHTKLTDIALGTDTSGNYVATISSGNGLTGAGSSEGSTPTLSVVAGTELTSNATGVHHNDIVRTNTVTGNTSPNYSGTFTAVDSITTNARGHVTGVNTKTVTMPTSNNTTYDLAAIANTTASNAILRLTDSGNSNDNIFFVGTDEVVTSSNATHIVIDHADVARANNTSVASPGSGGTFTAVDSITTNARGHVTAINTKTVTLPIDPDTNTTYDLAAIANTTASNAILRLADSNNSNDNVFFVGTDEVVTSSNATHIVIDHADVARANNTTVASPASGGTFTAVDSITTNARGHVTAINTKTVTLPVDPDTNTTYDLLAVANTAAGLLRLSASTLANDTVTFTGTGLTNTSSNSTHVIINSRLPVDDDSITDATRYLVWWDGSTSPTTLLNISSGGLGAYDAYVTFNSNTGILSSTGLSIKKPLRETRVAMPANNIDLNTGAYFTKTVSGSTTFTVSNTPATGNTVTFILDIINGGSATVTWFSGVKWAYGYAPLLTTSGRDLLGFTTYDGGTTWAGLVLGYDVK